MIRTFALIVLIAALAACAGPNGTAAGNNNGAIFGADIFKARFP